MKKDEERKAIRKGNYQETLVAMKSLKVKYKTLIVADQGWIVESLKNNSSSHRHSSNLTCAIAFFVFLYCMNEKQQQVFFVNIFHMRRSWGTWEICLEDKHNLTRSFRISYDPRNSQEHVA